jgi:hypothetical protein
VTARQSQCDFEFDFKEEAVGKEPPFRENLSAEPEEYGFSIWVEFYSRKYIIITHKRDRNKFTYKV